ncbi:helix-turn-helix domain-containing protein [Macrococcus capreoli]|uniref:helix-turn-helix domain-containing protein n=1 Tax=Macrococcus capreoli TaxID=2982690 RepID=UPI0021D5A3D7|nr:helix-turn-helix domain-containing protein [Macrococcus sp. TMW 2.2395]MCU7558610.1 helix-turn-helix domain-containing protein [Macrococcus sp. TMW 2.2395]
MKKEEQFMNEYLAWKTNNINNKSGFFPIYNDFLNHLNNLSPGAVSLYLYFGINSKNMTGESFHSIEKISDYFDRTPRTITNWINELEEYGLIERKQKGYNKVAVTYLKPYY